MGSIVSILLYYYCQSGCQASVVASYLAFHPPESTYTITDEGDEKSFHIIDSTIDDEYLSVHIINTQRSSIPVLVFTHPKAKFTIIFSHGNASDLGGMYSMLHGMCVSLEVNVVGYDYTGYGPLNNANTRPTEKQTYRDIESVYNWLSTSGRIKDPSREIIVYGQSVGSGPSCYLAFKYPIAGLVLHSGIMSGIRVLTSSRLLWCFDIFPNIDRIRHVKCPVFIMHGQVYSSYLIHC
jgi:hypothetical protein